MSRSSLLFFAHCLPQACGPAVATRVHPIPAPAAPTLGNYHTKVSAVPQLAKFRQIVQTCSLALAIRRHPKTPACGNRTRHKADKRPCGPPRNPPVSPILHAWIVIHAEGGNILNLMLQDVLETNIVSLSEQNY